MAFVIPSKHIYNKDNDKLRDNKIDRIEVGAFEVVPNNEYETPVYNEKITNPIVIEETEYELKNEKYKYLEEDSAAEYEDYIGVYAGITAKYTNIDINIPKLLGKSLISDLVINKDDESKIGITLTCEIRHYSVSAEYNTITNTILNIQKTENEQEREIKNGVNIQRLFSKENGEKGYLYHSKTEKKYGVYGGSVSVETEIKDTNNILSTTYKDEPETYKIEGLKILSGATSLGLSGHSGDYNYIYLTGEEVDYTPVSIEITIYGNTIGIDLTDKTIYIPNQSGNKPFFVEGNELMQTNYLVDVPFNVSNLVVKTGSISGGTKRAWIELANGVATNNKIKIKANIVAEGVTTPKSEEFVIYKNNFKSGEKTITVYSTVEIISATIEDTQISESFSKTLSSYSQGKETATIRCAIADYINYISATVVEYIKYDEENRVWCVLDVKTAYLAEKILQAENLKIHGVECMVVDAEDTKIYINFYSLSIVPYLEKGTLTIPLKEISTTNNVGKMAFDIYDEVIPMVYTANQTDKPMSRYKDGSAKTFVVLGTKIYFDGAVWQELTLQEK